MLPLSILPQPGAARAPAAKRTSYPPAVINLTVINAARAANILRGIYPGAAISVDPAANAVIVIAPPDEVSAMRTVITGIDIKSPAAATVDVVQVQHARPGEIAARIRSLFPHARFTVATNRTILVSAIPADMAQIKSVIAAIDTPPASASPRPVYPAEAVRVTQRSPREIARAVARSTRDVRVTVSGSEVLLSGPPDEVAHLKDLVGQLDVPQTGVYTALYRFHYVDATSVADLLRRSFPGVPVQVDKDLNAITVSATSTIQKRIGDGVAQLDAAPAGAPGGGGGAASGGGGGSIKVITLKAAIPGQNGSPSTSGADLATTIQSALSNMAPDLKVTVPPNSTQIILAGSPYSIQQAEDLIAQLDVPIPEVVLDTEVLEVDEATTKQLGLKFPTALLSTTYTELAPVAPTGGGQPPPLLGLQPLTRTPLTLSAELDFLVSTNKARILEDPRLTTFSGHTASLRAGETLNILTTAGGGAGTVATTQVQSFQTGVTLDITPVVNSDDYVTVSLHPSVNTFAGSSAGVPNIQTRDATTTVGLHDGETLVIGGLIEEDTTRNAQKIPLLGDLPLIGKLFRDTGLQYTRNELIITVTPHIVRPGENAQFPGPPLPAIPTPQALPTLPPGITLPTPGPASFARPQPIATAAPAFDTNLLTPPPVESTPNPSRSKNSAARSTPVPSGSPSPAPQALPTAFTQTNAYTYGSAPQNNYADPQAPPQIFYAQVQPTVVKSGQPMTVSVITTTNVNRLTFGPSPTNASVQLAKIGPGKWQSTFNFSTSGLPATQGNVQMALTAYSNTGAVATIQIPLSLINP